MFPIVDHRQRILGGLDQGTMTARLPGEEISPEAGHGRGLFWGLDKAGESRDGRKGF